MLRKSKASNRSRPITTSRHLKVAHYKHTGHVLPKSSTSYPMLAMIVLCVGIFLGTWTSLATADFPGPVTNSYTVSVSVPGPPPSVGATIISPKASQTFTATPISVSGGCPANTYESLYSNGVFSGVIICSQDGTFNIQSGLFPGLNQLAVQDYSVTGVPGPLSSLVTVDYQPPAPPVQVTGTGTTTNSSGSSSSLQSSSSSSSAEPLIFKTNFKYKGYYVGQATNWQIDLEGGEAPYAVSVDWGDGTHGLISRTASGNFDLTHIYKKPGGYKGSYVISLTASDANNQQAYLQLVTIVNNPPAVFGSTTKSSGGSVATSVINTTSPKTVERYVWSSYGILVLMLISFWLGERQILGRLRPSTKGPHRAM
jgi:hypothetical protein